MSVNTSFGRHAWALRCRFDRDTDPSEAIAPSAASPSFSSSDSPRLRPGIAALIEAFRQHGHRHARLDPLGDPPGVSGADPVRRAGFGSGADVGEDVDAFHLLRFGLAAEDSVTDDGATVLGVAEAGALHRRLSALYCGSLTLDLSAVRDESRRAWWSARFESDDALLSTDAACALLRRLARVEGWERHLAKRFPHGKRFSLEGNEALLPLLDTLLEAAVAQGVDQVLMGMPHRGRVNVLANLMGHPVDALIDYFEPAPAHPERQRDLVYHLGGTSRVQTAHGAVRLRLASNPSHLQSVYPVVVGMARAARSAAGERPERCMAVVMHGDAAFAGQGVVMETLALGLKPGYEVGGVIHVVINNQLGFTEPNPMDATSARYCTDATRGVDAPVLRVHADDPEAVLRAARLAVDYRARFGTDVVIDLVGYRRLGHSEHDVPQLTSPALYRRMPAKAGVTALYAERLRAEQRLPDEDVATMVAEVDAFDPTQPLDSAVPLVDGATSTSEKRTPIGDLHDVLEALAQLPEGFDPHALLRDQASRWRGMADDARRPADWCTAETLAWAQVLRAGVGVRISGLDVQRGTFLHRHAVWHHQGREVDTGGLSVAGEGEKRGDPRIGGPSTWTPLSRFASEGARLEVVNSLLAEEAVLGFEYGHSVQARDVMTVWEAQFGDFVNGAQVYLDQYLSSGEEKWGDTSALTVLLPHGYEGVGPEHSNGFLARVLQLCGADNLRVAMPSTSGQYAALLQRQALDPVRKPLIVMTPKAVLLAEPRSHTPVGVLAASGFEPVLDDDTVNETQAGAVRRVVLSSGKVHYDLLSARQAMAGSLADPMAGATALVRVEQLYPFPREALAAVLQRYPLVEEIVWTQEETRNQGPWHFVRDELDGLLPAGARLREVSRTVTAAGATASPVIHRWQQAELVRRAFLT